MMFPGQYNIYRSNGAYNMAIRNLISGINQSFYQNQANPDLRSIKEVDESTLPPPTPQPEKGFLSRAYDDVANTVSNYVTGAQQGISEFKRTQDRLNQMMGEQHTAQEWRDASAQSGKAFNAVVDETVKPVVMPAALLGGPAAIVAAPLLADDAINAYKSGGLGQVARDFTYGGAVDFANQPDLAQQFRERPISTAASGAMSVLPLALMARGGYQGVKGVRQGLERTAEQAIERQEINPFGNTEPVSRAAERPMPQEVIPVPQPQDIATEQPVSVRQIIDRINLPKEDSLQSSERSYGSAAEKIVNEPMDTTIPMARNMAEQAVEPLASDKARYTRKEQAEMQQPRGPMEYVADKWGKVYQAMFDDKAPIAKVPGSDTLYKQARVANAKAYGMAQEFIKGPSNSLETILKPVERDMNGFSKYIEAVHSADQQAAGLKTNMGPLEISKAIESSPPEFRQAQQQIVQYNNRLLSTLVDSGILTPESVAAMKEKWPNYVPFMRDFSDTEAMETFIKQKGFINASNPIKKLKGSERQIYDPLESIIKNTYAFTNIAERNKVGRELVKLPTDLVEAVPNRNTSDPKLSIFTVWENGEKRAYQTTPELYRAMASLDDQGSNFIVNMLSVPASTLRAGATLNPEFMARNLTRDAVGAFINSQTGFIPVVDTIKGLSHALKKDDLYWEWMREGGGMATMVGLDRNYLKDSIKQFKYKTAVDKIKTAVNPNTYLDVLRTFSEYSELGTRLGVYGKARSKGVPILDAIMDSREASLDFGRAGTHGRQLNKPIAFFNAALQDADKMTRLLTNKKTYADTMAKIGLAVVLPSAVTWYMGKDDERVQRLPSWQKDLFWIIPTSASGPGWDGLVRIPKPFGYGVLFGSSTERMLDWGYRNKNAFKGYGESMLNAFVPSLVPTAAIPIMEWWANKSFFSGHDIVPQREEKLPPRLQYGPQTTEVSKTIGNTFNVSPRKLDNTIYGYTGGLGREAAELSEFAIGSKNEPTKSVTQYPFIRGFTATSYRGSQSMQDFYDAIKKNDEVVSEAKFNDVKPDSASAKNKKILANASKIMQELRKQEREAMGSEKLNPDQKRDKIDRLQILQTKLAEATLKKIQ